MGYTVQELANMSDDRFMDLFERTFKPINQTGQPHQNSIQNMFCNRFVKIVLKKMCYLGNKADIADSKTLTMKNNLSDWIFYVSILQPKSFDYDS